MNKRVAAMLRRVERSLEAIDSPQTYRPRTISPTVKIKELENLVQKMAECQSLVDCESDQEWLNGVKETLKARLDEVFNTQGLYV